MGVCPCKKNFVEILERHCVTERSEKRMFYSQSSVVLIIAFVLSASMAVMARKRIIFMKLIDFCQLSSLYLLMALRFPFKMDWALSMLRYATVESILAYFFEPWSRAYTAAGLK